MQPLDRPEIPIRALDAMPTDDTKPNLKRRWPIFGWRTLLLLATLAGVCLGWLWWTRGTGQSLVAARRKVQRAAALSRWGASSVLVEPTGPSWSRPLLGRSDYFRRVVEVTIETPGVSDSAWRNLEDLTDLTSLVLDCPGVTDGELETIQGLSALQTLWIECPQVTDEGAARLAGLSNLKNLWLVGTKVTDAGLVHLHGLKNLERLYVTGTGVTREGVAKLRESVPRVRVWRDASGQKPPSLPGFDREYVETKDDR